MFIKALMVIGIITSAVLANVEINETNFPCPIFRNWVKTEITGGSDFLTQEMIDATIFMGPENLNITDLTGIEFFTALKGLDCDDNLLTFLDVSKNVNLKELDCTGNRLTSVKLNVNITDLDLDYNELTSLDVSNLANLRYLWVVGNFMADETAVIGFDGEWDDHFFRFHPQRTPTSITKTTNKKSTSFAFAGIKNGQINLRLTAGNYTAELYNLQGRLVGRANINATNGINATDLRTDNLSRGVFILNVKRSNDLGSQQAGNSVLRQKISVR